MILALALNFSALDFTMTSRTQMCECIARQHPTIWDSYHTGNNGRRWNFHVMLDDNGIVEAPKMLAEIDADSRWIIKETTTINPANNKIRVARKHYVLESKPIRVDENNSYWRIAKR